MLTLEQRRTVCDILFLRNILISGINYPIVFSNCLKSMLLAELPHSYLRFLYNNTVPVTVNLTLLTECVCRLTSVITKLIIFTSL